MYFQPSGIVPSAPANSSCLLYDRAGMNQLQAIAMNEGAKRKKGLWSKSGREQIGVVPAGAVDPWASARSTGVAGSRPAAHWGSNHRHRARGGAAAWARRLMTHSGVGP